MSDIKITYKPVDKKAKVAELLYKGYLLTDTVEQIDAIYNAKEEIENARIGHIGSGFQLDVTQCNDGSINIRIGSACCGEHITMNMTKQEARCLGQVLVKMSEQE